MNDFTLPGGFFLGIDTGATKTHALLTDGRGQVLAFESRGCANPTELGGLKPLQGLLADMLQAVCAAAGISLNQIDGAGLGLAGFDWPSQEPRFMRMLAEIGLPAASRLVNDSALGIYAGTTDGWGVCLAAGTSFNCRALGPDGRQGRAIGDGSRWGEGAGAEELVQRAANRVIDQWCQRGSQTRLTDVFMQHFDARETDDLVEGMLLRRYPIRAELAPKVIACAQAGDAVARQTVGWAARQLAYLARGAIHQAGLQDMACEVVLAGSFFNAGDILIQPLTAMIMDDAPLAVVKRLALPPVCGGILLGMQAVAGLTPPQRAAVLRSLHAYFNP